MTEEELIKKLDPKLEKEIKKLKIRKKIFSISDWVASIIGAVTVGGTCIATFLPAPVYVFEKYKEEGNIPFVLEEEQVSCLCDEHVFDSMGNDEHKLERVDFDPVQEPNRNMLSYHSKWENKGDCFEQVVKTYQIDETVYKKILEKSNNNIPLENIIEDILGNPSAVDIKKEKKVSIEELNKDAYFQATIYKPKENACVVHKESVSENIIETVEYLLYTILCEVPSVGASVLITLIFAPAVVKMHNCISSEVYQAKDELNKREEVRKSFKKSK